MHLNQQIDMMHSDLLPFPKSAAEDFDFNASSYNLNHNTDAPEWQHLGQRSRSPGQKCWY